MVKITQIRETIIFNNETFYRFKDDIMVSWSTHCDGDGNLFRKYQNEEQWFRVVESKNHTGFLQYSNVPCDKPVIEQEYEKNPKSISTIINKIEVEL